MMQTPATSSSGMSLSEFDLVRKDNSSTPMNPNFYESTPSILRSQVEQIPVSQPRFSIENESREEVRQNVGSKPSFPSLLERCKNQVCQSIHLHLLSLVSDIADPTKDIRCLMAGKDWITLKKLLAPIDVDTQIDYIPIEDWMQRNFHITLSNLFSNWSEEIRNELEEQLNIFLSCLDSQEINTTRSIFELFHKALKQNVWVKLSNEFTPIPGKPSGGSAPERQFFRDSKGNRWLGKCGPLALYDSSLLPTHKEDFISPYADELLEKLGLAIYNLVGLRVPDSTLSYQPVTEEVALQFECFFPRLHFLSKWIDDFQVLGDKFVSNYLIQAKQCGQEYVKIKTVTGEELPLIGLGRMLAAADFLYDLDCIGNQGGNVGYVIEEDNQTGERYAQVVKIDAGYAFSYYKARYEHGHDPRDRKFCIRPEKGWLGFADLAPLDQRDFANAARRILSIPREEFAYLFAHAENTDEGIPKRHAEALLDGLIDRKNLFLKAFYSETDRIIVEEIEAAQLKLARKMESSEEISSEAVEQLLAKEKEDSKVLAALKASLAIAEVRGSEPKKLGECKTFQLPNTTTNFVGRTEAIATVIKQLNQSHGSVIGQSISGIGGVGKTQLALHYAQAAANGERVGGEYLVYDYVVWLNAEVFLEGQFQALVEVWLGRQCKAEEAVEEVYGFLRGKRTLLVFDNAENARSIAAFLPPPRYASPVHLLITSRSSQWGEIPTIKLDGFNLDEACEYVECHLGRQPKEEVKKLLELLGGLPLAMSQAVSYIRAGHCTLEGFEEQFYLNQANLFSLELLLEESHPKTVGTTLMLSLAQAKIKSRIAEKLLGVAAYLAPDSIQIELLTSALEHSKEEIIQAIKILESYSLLGFEGENVQVHRLVQEVMRHRHKYLEEPQCYWNKVVRLLIRTVNYDEMRVEELRQCSHAIAHIQRLGKLTRDRKLSKEQELVLADLLKVGGMHQQIMGNYEVERDFQEQALEIKERHYGPDHPDVAIMLGNLGIAYGALGNARKQKELLERSLLSLECHYGADHPDVARILESLGTAYGTLGNARKQKELLEQSLLSLECHYGADHLDVAKTLMNLGTAYGTLGNAITEKELLERSLAIYERHYGLDHPDVAKTLANLSNVYGSLGDARKKKELLERSLVIFEHHYGPDHPDVARTLASLGNVYSTLGDARKKKELLERSLVIFEHHYGPGHPDVAGALASLGTAYGELGDTSKEKELLERSLVIYERHYGPDHPDVARTLGNLGIAYGNLGDTSKKKELLERSLVIYERYYGPDHPDVARTLGNLGIAYGDLDDTSKKKELLERSLTIYERHYGPDHPDVARTLANLGTAYGDLGDTSKEEELLERSLIIYERHYGPDHPDVARTLANLGNIYGNLGDARKKKELLERSLVIFEHHYGPDHFKVAITRFNLGSACLELGHISEANDYAQKAFSVFKAYYGENHQNTLRAKKLLYECAVQIHQGSSLLDYYLREFLSQSTHSAERISHSGSQPIENDLEMIEIIIRWVEELEQQFERWEVAAVDKNSASIFVGMVLEIMKTGQWEQFLESPTSYGIPEEAVAELALYREVPRILAHIDRYSQLIDELSASLVSGGGVSVLRELVEAFRIG